MATKVKKSILKKSRTTNKKVSKRRLSPKKIVKSALKSQFRTDSKQTASLVKIGRISAAKAIRESKALGLSIVYMQDGFLYKESPNGKIEILEQVSEHSKSKNLVVFKKGMIFHAKK